MDFPGTYQAVGIIACTNEDELDPVTFTNATEIYDTGIPLNTLAAGAIYTSSTQETRTVTISSLSTRRSAVGIVYKSSLEIGNFKNSGIWLLQSAYDYLYIPALAFSFGDVVTDSRNSGGSNLLTATATAGANLYLAFRSADLSAVDAGTDTNYTVAYSSYNTNGTSYVEFSYNNGIDNSYNQTTLDATGAQVLSLVPVYGRSYGSYSISALNSKTPPAINCNVGDILLVVIFYQDFGTTPIITVPSGYTLLSENNSTIVSGNHAGLAIAYKQISSSGIETPSDWIINYTLVADIHYSMSILLT